MERTLHAQGGARAAEQGDAAEGSNPVPQLSPLLILLAALLCNHTTKRGAWIYSRVRGVAYTLLGSERAGNGTPAQLLYARGVQGLQAGLLH